MKIIVLKFGGTSVGTLDRIVKISKIIVSYIISTDDFFNNEHNIILENIPGNTSQIQN